MATFRDTNNLFGWFEDETYDATSLGNSDDNFFLGLGNDLALGGAGNDIFYDEGTTNEGYFESGFDKMFGGSGFDLFNVTDTRNFIDGGDDIDGVSFLNYSHDGNYGNNIDPNQGVTASLADTTHFDSVENMIGSRFDDFLTGSSADNIIRGYDGNDELNGGAGADTLDGGKVKIIFLAVLVTMTCRAASMTTY